jgi:hemolysin III
MNKPKSRRIFTSTEEIINSVSHGVGALLGIAMLVVGILFAAVYMNVWGIVSMSIYGSSLILLFLMSTIYHGLTNPKAKAVFRVLDHMSIFILIAGSYTPYTLVIVRQANPLLGWTIFGLIWGLAVLGMFLNFLSVDKFSKISMVIYLGMGWMVVLAMGALIPLLSPLGLTLLLAGGITYTLGAVVFGLGEKIKYLHCLWHFFVLGGALLHYFAIFIDVILPHIQ